MSNKPSPRTLALLVAIASTGAVLGVAPGGTAAPVCQAPLFKESEPLELVPGMPAGWQAGLVYDPGRLPPIPMVVATGPGGTCDLTHDLSGFLAIADVADPLLVAQLVAATTFPDQLGLPMPLVVRGAKDGFVELTTWSQRDGLIVDWRIHPGTLERHFVVRAVSVGGVPDDFEGWHVWPGFTDLYLDRSGTGLLATKTHLAPNGDGTQFRITYFTQNYANEAEADAYAAAYGVAANTIHDVEVDAWGFSSADADNTYDITADGCNCIFSGNNVNIHVSPKLESLVAQLGLQYPTNAHFYRVVIGHEFHHHLQFSIQQWRIGNVLVEGGARFSETAFEPEGAFGPKTIQYLPNANGFSSMLLNPNVGPSGRTYNFGLFWGFLYGTDGGVDVLREVYEESNNVNGNPDTAIPEIVDRALANVPAAVHADWDEAYADFAVHMFTKSFVWEGRDWGTFLPPVTRVGFTSLADGAANTLDATVALRGILVGDAKRMDPMATTFAGDRAVTGTWAWKTPGGLQTHAADPVFLLADGPVDDAVLIAIRGPNVAFGNAGFGPGNFKATIAAPLDAL